MLYVSTRNAYDVYTSHHALHEFRAPDGGLYAPYHFSRFSSAELDELKQQSPCFAIAKVLNLFFGLQISAWDVEFTIGRAPYKTVTLQHNVHIAEFWHNPNGTCDYLFCRLYGLITGSQNPKVMPQGWALVAIKVALLFSLYSSLKNKLNDYDVAVFGGFSNTVALSYARELGFPINMTIWACNDEDMVWDLIRRGEYNVSLRSLHMTSSARAVINDDYLELFILKHFDVEEVMHFLTCAGKGTTYHINEHKKSFLSKYLYPTVISNNRAETIQSGLYQTSEYQADTQTALAFCGLLDYRSQVAFSNNTLFISMDSPKSFKE